MGKIKKKENTELAQKVNNIAEKLYKIAVGEEEPAFKGQHYYIKLFLETAVPKNVKVEKEETIKIEFADPELVKSLVNTLVQLNQLPKSAEVIDAEIIGEEDEDRDTS